MVRSLFAIIAATIIGLAAAKFTEGASQTILTGQTNGEPAGLDAAITGRQFGLVFAWLVGAFVAALCALMIGRRWAPLGALAAATIFFSAVITIASFSLHWALWPLSAIATAAGGYAAIFLLGAKNDYPARQKKRKIFDG